MENSVQLFAIIRLENVICVSIDCIGHCPVLLPIAVIVPRLSLMLFGLYLELPSVAWKIKSRFPFKFFPRSRTAHYFIEYCNKLSLMLIAEVQVLKVIAMI